MDSTNRRYRIAGGLIPINVQEGDMAVDWPSPAACAQRLTAAADAVAVHSDRRARRRCGCVLAITRGLRHAAHGRACGVVRGCIPIDVQEGDVAGYWPSPAARAQRLTAAADAVAVHSIEAARRGYGCGLAITRGLRPIPSNRAINEKVAFPSIQVFKAK
jgi:hypothetical protein